MCRVGIHHKNDFEEVMLIVQISIGNCEIMDVLLDGGYGMNIISNIVEDIRLEKTSFGTIYGKNIKSKKGTTSRANMELQNQINRVYV